METKFDAEVLKQAQRRKNLTTLELAERLGCAPGTISRIRSGAQQPGPQMVRRIAEELNIPVESMYEPVPHGADVAVSSLSDEERVIVGVLRRLSDHARGQAIGFILGLSSSDPAAARVSAELLARIQDARHKTPGRE